ncbi:hypothetical protein GWK41_03000 [Persephonella atlantica]|uniref:Uncharacterized protein n=2 Tax=Persephonella atlantica TaxID=2699429 RepID=A0ABS1GGJ3_9AQUI|nr:hypothetical protein [Persephonella atlantica]
MEVGSWLWKVTYMIHVISNAAFFGISLVFTFGNDELMKEAVVKRYLKISSGLIFFTGATGILLLSILSMSGMDDLTNNAIGQSALAMILGYTIVLFVFSLALIYKGGEARIYKKLFGIMFFSYLFIYLIRVYLTT